MRRISISENVEPVIGQGKVYKPPLDVYFLDIVSEYMYADNLQREYKLPPELWWVAYYTSKQFENLKIHPYYFHGTRVSRLPGIMANQGLKMFPEKNAPQKLHSVYATPDPILAAYHAYENGPEDSHNDAPDKRDPNDPIVILKIDIDKICRGEQLEKLRSAAVATYEGIQRGGKANYVGERMGNFVPESSLSLLIPTNEDGETTEVSLPAYLENK